jgi:spoIIIJ-associated protein
VEWVETTGRTVAEAKDHALDQLGVDEQDAEFEVLAEPRTGLFGRLRGEARVRARVRPTRPRPKFDRREARRARRSGQGQRTGSAGGRRAQTARSDGREADAKASSEGASAGVTAATAAPGGEHRGRRKRGRRSGRQRASDGRSGDTSAGTDEQGENTMSEIDLDQQEQVVGEFLRGLVDAFGFDAEVRTSVVAEDEAVDAGVEGQELGLLVGSKGATLNAIQELTRSVVQRRMPGERHGRLRLDVAGYRERRRQALERFARQVADEVRESGSPRALEPMPPPDRKVVHDTINAIEGVSTTSEGEEPHRRVLIMPDSAAASA